MNESIDDRACSGVVREHLRPVEEGEIGRDAETAAFVATRDYLKTNKPWQPELVDVPQFVSDPLRRVAALAACLLQYVTTTAGRG